MADLNLSLEEFSKKELENLMSSKLGLKRFVDLLQISQLEKKLLQISSNESAEFILNTDQFLTLRSPKIDRLVLVYPPAFAFSMEYQLSGYFKVKYNSTSNPLPIQVEPFKVKYSGILIPNDDEFDIKNEKITIIEY